MRTEERASPATEVLARVGPEQRVDIEALRANVSSTRRATSAAMEELLYVPIPVLDHGFVRVIDYMGDDAAVVQAARVSYGAGTKRRRDDAGLINYLMRNRHTSPFEMCELKVHMKLPIFVARQQVRHRMANINETSGRYSILDREFYVPEPEQLATQATANRQGRGEVLEPTLARRVLEMLRADAERAYDHYERLLGETGRGDAVEDGIGLARELARMGLTLNFYTQWYWKIDLHNLLGFVALRADAHAQYEIRVYAEALLDVVKRWVPLTYDAFVDHRMGAVQLSAKALAAVRRMLAGEDVERESSGMSPGEWRELMETLGRS
ncbi:MAG: FAD-dependent thymidylate synthase [Chloroflexota bacterium]|nr:FAD-dependent thymidylate synthase [Chloroflexota bacterium]